MQEKFCEYCKKPLTKEQIKNGNRFCSTSCSAYWRNKTYGDAQSQSLHSIRTPFPV